MVSSASVTVKLAFETPSTRSQTEIVHNAESGLISETDTLWLSLLAYRITGTQTF